MILVRDVSQHLSRCLCVVSRRQSTPVTLSVCGVIDPPPARLSCSTDKVGRKSASAEQYESGQRRVNPAHFMGRICVKLPTRGCVLGADSMVHFSFFFPLPLLLKNVSCDFRVRFPISPSCLPSFDSVAGIPSVYCSVSRYSVLRVCRWFLG